MGHIINSIFLKKSIEKAICRIANDE